MCYYILYYQYVDLLSLRTSGTILDSVHWLFKHCLSRQRDNAHTLSSKDVTDRIIIILNTSRHYQYKIGLEKYEYTLCTLTAIIEGALAACGRHRSGFCYFIDLLFLCLMANILGIIIARSVLSFDFRAPDITVMVDWALKTNYLSIYLSIYLSGLGFLNAQFSYRIGIRAWIYHSADVHDNTISISIGLPAWRGGYQYSKLSHTRDIHLMYVSGHTKDTRWWDPVLVSSVFGHTVLRLRL